MQSQDDHEVRALVLKMHPPRWIGCPFGPVSSEKISSLGATLVGRMPPQGVASLGDQIEQGFSSSIPKALYTLDKILVEVGRTGLKNESHLVKFLVT